jgi:hypothetical protein
MVFGFEGRSNSDNYDSSEGKAFAGVISTEKLQNNPWIPEDTIVIKP